MSGWRSRARNANHVARMALSAPLMIGRILSSAKATIDADVRRWASIVDAGSKPSLLALLARYKEFRTLYYYRLRRANVFGAAFGAVAQVVWHGERTLHLTSSEIGPGLFIQHGFATIVAASRVGADCWINQQVTIGFDRPDARPVLGDGVAVHAGAKVLGAVTIGDGARIGANAVVLEDVPPGCTAVGVPARILPPKRERAGSSGRPPATGHHA